MATKKELRSELDWITEKISSQVWILNLGTLGTTWSLLIASGLPAGLRFTTRNAIWVFIPSLLSLLCEMGQYLCGYFLAHRLLDEMEENNTTEFQYPKDDWLYKWRHYFFCTKIVLTIGAAVVLLVTILRKLT
jgi:hypothetical protein